MARRMKEPKVISQLSSFLRPIPTMGWPFDISSISYALKSPCHLRIYDRPKSGLAAESCADAASGCPRIAKGFTEVHHHPL